MKEPLAVSISEAARMIGLAPRTLRDWCQRRIISHHRLGRRILIPVKEISRLLDESRVHARDQASSDRRLSRVGHGS